ncbi:hypothetical protein [Lentibacter sp. XHP0401]|uniref:hypothetical protein n=1 Tax=Lentibacter sp. XHP0401 TaxID=2984334 RepID=UPI0021E70148|nr:hypothetical protein [Lentibacter sp. XHP0401]MCV2894274.1 hypothetical protein [Lentibacter sp. XHP0401]
MKQLTLPIMAALWVAQAVSGNSQSLQPRIDELAAGMDDFAPQVEELPLEEITDDFGAPEDAPEAVQTAPEQTTEQLAPEQPAATVAVIPEGWKTHSLLGITFAAPTDWQLMSDPDDEDELNLGKFNMTEKRAVALMVERQHPGGVDGFEQEMEGLPKQAARDMALDLSSAEQSITYPEPIIAPDGRRLLRKVFTLRAGDFFVYSHLFYKEDADERGGNDTLMVMAVNTPEAEAMAVIEPLLGTVALEAAPPPEPDVGLDGLLNYMMPPAKGWKRYQSSSDYITFLTTPTMSASFIVETGYRARSSWDADDEFANAPQTSRGEIFGLPADIKQGLTNASHMQVGVKFVQALRTVYKLDICMPNGDPVVVQQYAAEEWLKTAGYDSLLAPMSLALPAEAIPCPAEGAAVSAPKVMPATDWTRYTNSRFGTSVKYPISHFTSTSEQAENSDGQTFANHDRSAEILVWGGHNALEQTAQQMVDDILANHAGADILAHNVTAQGFTLKLQANGQVLQQHSAIVGGDILHNVRVLYPANQEDNYGPVAQEVVDSLSIAPTAQAPTTQAPAAKPQAQAAKPTSPSDMEQAFWNSVSGTSQTEGFEAYLEQWPNGAYAAEARARIAGLTAPAPAPASDPQVELAFWQSVQNSSDPAMFQAYLDQWPNGTFAVLARLNLKRLQAVAVTPNSQPAPSPAPAIRQAPSPRGYYTPAPKTSERAAIMDAARVPMLRELGQRVIFLVKTLRTDGDWCFLMAEPLQPNGNKLNWRTTPYANDWANDAMSNLVMVLMRKQGNGWQVIDYVVGPTDVHWYNWIDGYGLPERLFTPG